MAQTTWELDAGVVERLDAYAAYFARGFGRIERARWCRVYLEGLLRDGERKSIEPLSRRVALPGFRGDAAQALQQFVNQSPWNAEVILGRYRARLAEAFADPRGVLLIDDTGFAKQGRHSVGVARQYSGTLGKRGNCQVAVSLHYAAPTGDYPLGLRLYLPETWTAAPDHLAAAGVPVAAQAFQTKGELALALLDQVRAEGLPHRAVVADAGYGQGTAFRRGLEERGEVYAVGLTGEEVVFVTPPTWAVPASPPGRGGRTRRWYVTAATPVPVPVRDLALTLARTAVTWRPGSKGPLRGDFAWVRVWPAHRWQDGRSAEDIPDSDAEARWLLVDWRADGTVKYALSNLPADTPLEDAVALWKTRWQVEQGYQQLKEELGLDHFEGRSWVGFHHHAALTCLAYGFLALERARGAATVSEMPAEVTARPRPLARGRCGGRPA